MKRIIATLLIVTSLLSLTACKKNKYKPVESNADEIQTVMTLSVNGETYEVKYELYRAFFLTYKSMVDKGDDSVWTGVNKDKYIKEIDQLILNRVAEIYSAFAMCKEIGFDVYSKDVENKITENIRISVDGGSYGNTTIEGYESYEEYLEALKAVGMNYSVQVLLFRYAIAIDAIDTYYIGTASSDDIDANVSEGKLEYTKEDVKAFYFSDDCARVLRASFRKEIDYHPLERAEKLRDKIEEAISDKDALEKKELAAKAAIMGSGLYANAKEVETGYVIGRYNLEQAYYGAMADAALNLKDGEVSDPIEIVTDVENSYYVIYRTYKSESHFENNYDSIKFIYLMNCVGEISHGVIEELKASARYTDLLNSLDRSKIGM